MTKRAAATSSTQSTIVKAMGVFTGVRVVTILCSLIRNKLIAWLIGPAGMGLVSLYNSVVDLVGSTSRLSIDQTVQRDISQASGHDKTPVINIVRRWAVWLGLAGAAIMCVLSPLLSLWTFDTPGRWYIFCVLGVVPLCTTIANCSIAVNQGLRRFRDVASGTVWGALASLVVSVPLIVWLRINSILWVIVVYGLFTLGAAWLFRARVPRCTLTRQQIYRTGRSFLRLGLNITVAQVFTQAMAYVFVLFLNNYASTAVLGTYQAGYTLVNSYVGIILTGIWIEYYPRLAAMAHSPARLSVSASYELKVTMLVLMPVLSTFIALADPIIRLIYDADFLSMLPYVTIGAVGVVLRATSWCMSFIILARGDGRTFLFTEGISVVTGLGLNIAGYVLGGYAGLGISYILWYALYTLLVIVVCRRKYGVAYHPKVVALSAVTFVTVSAALVCGHFAGPVVPIAIAIITAGIAWRKLKI